MIMERFLRTLLTVGVMGLPLTPLSALASKAQLGEPLPTLKITDRGRLHLTKDDIIYKPWSSKSLRGKPYVVQYLPARAKSGQLNVPLNDALLEIDKDERCRTVSVVDVKDHDWGTGIFIKGAMESNFKRTPLCVVVADDEGVGLTTWGFEEKQNVTMVINADGIVKYKYIGQLNKAQINNIIELLNGMPGWEDKKRKKNRHFRR